jgi:hypothetical protein
MELLHSADFWIGLVKIVWINIILSGDNAVDSCARIHKQISQYSASPRIELAIIGLDSGYHRLNGGIKVRLRNV